MKRALTVYAPGRPSPVARCLLVLAAAGLLAMAGCGQSDEDKAQLADEKYRDAQVSFNQRMYAKALEEITAAIALNTEIKRDSVLAENYLIQAHAYRQLGEYDKALGAFQFILREFSVSGDVPLHRRGRIALAQLYLDLGDDASAYTLASDAAAEGKVFNDLEGYARASMIAASAHHHLKHYDREIAVLRELLASAVPQKSPVHEAIVRSYVDAGRFDDARLALDGWRAYAGRDSAALGRSFAAEAYYYEKRARPDSMVRALAQALGLLDGPRTEAFEGELLTALGNAAYRMQRFDDARLSYTDAQRLARKHNDVAADHLLSAMLVACDRKGAGGRLSSQALADLARRARAIATSSRQVGFAAGEAFASLLDASFSYKLDSVAAAKDKFQRAIELQEQAFLGRQDETALFSIVRTFFESEHIGWYDPFIRVLGETGDKEVAFEMLERKNLEDLSSFFNRSVLSTGTPLVDRMARSVQSRRGALGLLQADLLEELRSGRLRSLDRIENLKRLLPQRLAEYRDLGDSLGQSPFRWLLLPGRLRYAQCQAALGERQALLEYAPVDNLLFALVVLQDTCYMKQLPASGGQAVTLAREYMRLLGDQRGGTGSARLNELSSILYSLLVSPVLPLLEGMDRCVIVPPPELGWVPFHALRGGSRGGILESQLEISYLPTAAGLLFPARKEQYVGDVVGVGHPGTTAWDVEYELKDIRGFYEKAKMLFDTTATLGHLAQQRYDLLHIAGEFTLDTDVPSRTALKLSDGRLAAGPSDVPLGTLLSLKSPHTIVFSNISATPGGLSRYAPAAFLAAGVDNFIGTLWQGDRKAKKYFGEVFYSNVMTGVPTATAYHLAVLALSRNPEFYGVGRWGLYYRFGR